MAKSLVIVESPAKAKTIEKILGKNYKVKASTGHVRDLPKKGLGVEVRKNFAPKYEVLAEKKKVVEELKEAAKEAESVFLAPDPDREGEAIAWHLATILGEEAPKDQNVQRIEFNEITKDAILRAIKEPRPIDMGRVNAQQARRVLDRLVGYKISPLLWYKVRRGLSAGRVQSVAVRMICDREEEVRAFVPKEYWSITANLQKSRSSFSAELAQINGKKPEINNEAESNAILDSLKDAEYKVDKVTPKDQKRQPSPPYITSTLQQEASRRYGFTVKRTMALAQQLYEGIELGQEGPVGLITYMRTDSVRVASEAQDEAREYIAQRYGKEYAPREKRVYKTKKGAQDAHEAIRPTSVARSPEQMKAFLSTDQAKLYRLIWERFLASQMASTTLRVTSVEITANSMRFRCADTKVVFPGFQAVYTEVAEDEAAEKPGKIPEMEVGDALKLKELVPKQHFTQPPPRYTEASLVKTLEEKGIGRPSTYAPTIATIQDRGYIEKEAKALKPTELGIQVNEQLVQHFPKIVDVSFTAEMENNLDSVETGEAEWQKIISQFYKPFQETLKAASKEMKPVAIPSGEMCEVCGQPMLIKAGRFGEFLACSGYPECKTTKPLLKKLGVACKAEGCTGELIVKRSRTGKTFYACTRYPDCTFTSWDAPTDQSCPVCGNYMVIKRSMKTGRTFLRCSNQECKHIGTKPKSATEETAEPVETPTAQTEKTGADK